jgi:hypothetical protein
VLHALNLTSIASTSELHFELPTADRSCLSPTPCRLAGHEAWVNNPNFTLFLVERLLQRQPLASRRRDNRWILRESLQEVGRALSSVLDPARIRTRCGSRENTRYLLYHVYVVRLRCRTYSVRVTLPSQMLKEKNHPARNCGTLVHPYSALSEDEGFKFLKWRAGRSRLATCEETPTWSRALFASVHS